MHVNKKAKYIRVSTLEQNTGRQKLSIERGIKLYEDKESGLIPFENRKAGKRLIADVLKGEINYIIIHSVDRLGRDSISMQKQLNWFIENGVQIYAENIKMELLNDDGSMNIIAKMIIDLLGSVAALEIETMKERQRQGIAITKANGGYKGGTIGRKIKVENMLKRHKDVVMLLEAGISVTKASRISKKAFVTVKNVERLLVAD